ncbi:MAG: glycosyltransferase family 39 protein [Candidatus Paceibacterota bacterium]|jgi:4-amino-4-deoxy-L-arabinose transferase-like glycosyltransferase
MLKNINKICRGSIPVLLILAIALFARLVLFFHDVTIDNDGIAYGLAGKNLVESGKYEVYGDPLLIYPPVYPIAIGIVDHFSGNLLFSGRFVSLLFGMLLVYAFYAFGKKLYGKEAGLFASFFAATNYSLVAYSSVTRSEMIYLFILALILYVYILLIEKCEDAKAAVLGSLMAALYLTRPEGLLMWILPILLFYKLLKKTNIYAALRSLAIIFLSFMIISAPYIYFLYENTGRVELTEKTNSNVIPAVIFGGSAIEDLSGEKWLKYEKSRDYYDEDTNTIIDYKEYSNGDAVSYVLKKPDIILNNYVRGIKSEISILFIEHGISLILLPLLLSFLFLFKKTKERESVAVLLLVAILYLMIIPVFHIESRYMLQVLVFLILISSLGYSFRTERGIKVLGIEFNGGDFFRIFRTITLFLVMIQFAFSIVNIYKQDDGKFYPWEYRLAGEFIGKYDTKENGVLIMSRNSYIISYYANAGNSGIRMPYADVPSIIRFARENKANYIVIDERFLSVRENYDELWKLDRFSNDAELIFEDSSVMPIRIFRFRDANEN